MLEICFGTYFVLGLPAMLLLWMALAVAKMHDRDGGSERQRHYRLMLDISNFKHAQYTKEM